MPNVVRFDCFEVDLESRQLQKRGVKVKLRGQSFQVLATLLEHPGRVVTRDDLCRRLWRDEVFVDFDNNLNIAVAHLREALGDSAEHPHFIETLPKHGYRFIASTFDQELPARRARLLVLPFVNLSGDPAEDYFSDAMMDEIITAIARLAPPDRLAVIARTTAMHYKGSRKDVGRIGREVGVDYVVEGAVRRDQEHVGINVQLIQTGDQSHVFAKKYDAEMRDIFQTHTEIAQDVAKHIPRVADDIRAGPRVERPGKEKPTEDLVAYNLYLQGRYWMHHDLARAKGVFEQALARDPNFALAYDGLGECYWWIGFVGLAAPKEAFSAGLWAALRAIEIDNTLAETHALLGQFRKELDYNWQEVEREMALARELNPESTLVRFRNALSGLMPLGRLDEAVAELEVLLESDPLDLVGRCWLAMMHWFRRNYEAGIAEIRLVLQIDPNFRGAFPVIGLIRHSQRKFDEAVTELRKTVELSGGAPVWLGWLGLALAQSGSTAEARAIAERLHAAKNQFYVPPSCFAWIHYGLGEIDEAFVCMNRSIDERDPMIIPIRSYDFLDPIRSDPRLKALLKKMNLDF